LPLLDPSQTQDLNMNNRSTTGADAVATAKRPWTAPEVSDLPRLTELTLQTFGGGIDGGGGTGGGGSTVF